MARLEALPDGLRERLSSIELPEMPDPPRAAGPPLSERRIAILSTAGLHRRGDPGFELGAADYRVIPWTTFTDPEVARVGLNELEAKEREIPYEVSTYGIDDLDRAIADGEDHGVV